MRFEERNHFMKLYAENPDTISMCIVKEGDKISARALIWNLENGKTYLERIYYTEDSLISFVTDNVAKLYPKELYSYNAGAPTGMVVNLKKVDFEKYPYADIMCFVHQKIVDGKIEGTGKISNSNRLELEGEWRVISIQSTSGDPSDLTHKKSKSLDIYIKNEEAVYLSELDDYFRKSDLNYSNYLRSYLTKEDSVYSEDIKDYIPKKEAIKHPKFGLVPKNKIFNVFDGYKVKEEPISIYNKFQSKNYSGLKLTEKLILEDSDYFNFFDILFTKNDVIEDIENEYIPKIICERIVRIDDDVKNSLKKDGLECLLIYDNILEIDAITLGIKYSNIRYADPVHTVIRVMENYGRIPYLNYINNIKNEKIKKERQLKFEAYDNYLKSNKSWIFNSDFKKEEIMDLFIETFNNAIEFGSSEKLFTWSSSENLDFYEFFKKCSYDIYGSYFNNIEESKKELLFSLYKRLMALYYLTMDSYDSKGYFRDNIENKELEILNGIVLSGDNGLEICREVVKTSHRQIFTLIQQSFDVLKDMDDSIDNLDIQDIRQFLRKEFYKHSNYELFKKLNDIV